MIVVGVTASVGLVAGSVFAGAVLVGAPPLELVVVVVDDGVVDADARGEGDEHAAEAMTAAAVTMTPIDVSTRISNRAEQSAVARRCDHE